MSARGWRLGAGAEGEDAVRSKKKEVVGALQASRGEAPKLGAEGEDAVRSKKKEVVGRAAGVPGRSPEARWGVWRNGRSFNYRPDCLE